MSSRRALAVITTAAAGAVSAQSANAADYTWTGATSTTWATPGNWTLDGVTPSATAPTADTTSDTAHFSGTPTTFQPNSTTATAVGGLNFETPGWTVTVATSGTGSLTLGGLGLSSNGSGSNSISSIFNVGANATFNIGTDNTFIVGGRLQGTVVVTKVGAGTLRINGNPANGAATVLGGFALKTGALAIANNFYLNQAATAGNAITLFGGTIVSSTGTGTVNTSGATIGSIVLRQTGTSTFDQILLFDASQNGRAVINADFGLAANQGPSTKTFNIQDGTDPIDVQFNGAFGSFNGLANIQPMKKTGFGAMELAHDNSSFTGFVSILEGRLIASRNNSLGLGSGVTIAPDAAGSAVLDLSAATVTTGAINDNGTLTLSSGTSGSFFGQVDFGIRAVPLNEIVGGLVIDGVAQALGTYSSANFPNFILGNGTITVIPEPISISLLGTIAGLGLLRRRRGPR